MVEVTDTSNLKTKSYTNIGNGEDKLVARAIETILFIYFNRSMLRSLVIEIEMRFAYKASFITGTGNLFPPHSKALEFFFQL